MDVTKPHKFMGFGAMYVSKPYKFIGFGAMDGIHTGKLRGTKREKLACELYHMETLISDCIFYVRCTVVRKQREPKSAAPMADISSQNLRFWLLASFGSVWGRF